MLNYQTFCLIIATISYLRADCPDFPSEPVSEKVHLSLLGDPHYFVPNSVYTVRLGYSSFTKFIVTTKSLTNEGNFQILNNGLSNFAEDCMNTIVEGDERRKDVVEILWTAPPSGCVTLKAAVWVEGVWYVESKAICSLKTQNIEHVESPSCCACHDAKYKLVFEGLWSPHTHPKSFPSNLWLTHFSDIIGASHSSNFSMWEEGSLASYGFKQLAEFGIIRELETELRNKSTQLRSIIKASGLWYPNLSGNTTAVFRVNPRNHLLSLASMFGPSPDWIVGISGLNLCLLNCSWIEDKVIDLYPYDAGTDDGVTYMSVNSPSEPQQKIHKITAMYPEDPRSPFYDPLKQSIKPLAKLYIFIEKVIPKPCFDLSDAKIIEQVSLFENTEEEFRAECAVTPYTDWSPCSVTCGKGIRMRTRNYISVKKSKLHNCNRQLVSKEMCIAEVPSCMDESEELFVPLMPNGECEVTAWSDWSDCSVSCGVGFILRTRTFVSHNDNIHKKCMHISTMEKEKCMLPSCPAQELEVPPAGCEISEWSEWSPCSVTCGKGKRIRIRQFVSSFPPKFCKSVIALSQSHSCANNRSCLIDPLESNNICSMDLHSGPCRGKFRKWGYDKQEEKCVTFYYGGCRGNQNRFETIDECQNICMANTGIKDKVINCVVSKWSSWTTCYPCENGTKTKTRKILEHPRNGGRSCPNLTKTITCRIPEEFCKDLITSNLEE